MPPQRYLPTTHLTAAPAVTLDTTAIRAVFEDIIANQPATEVTVTNNIDATDRDPEIVGSQIGRGIERELIG